MGTVFSFDVRGGEPDAVRAALEEAVAGLHRVNEVFSTYRDDSQVSRLARGELTVEECDPEVAEVLELGAEAERVSDGWFSMRYEGRLDPTGIVKGWAAERAARQLAATAGASGVSVNGGGDVQLLGTPGAAPALAGRGVRPAAPGGSGGGRLRGGRARAGGGHLRHRRARAPTSSTRARAGPR